MTTAGMLTDVAGRVRNVSLPTSKPLLPLFEAIINSIQAIEDGSGELGNISIRVIREKPVSLIESEKFIRDISSFEVIDDGIGFNNENFAAFSTSDTTYKASRGGKGIGRFVWLVAFDSVHIESTYEDSNGFHVRSFDFVAQGSGVENEVLMASTATDRSTMVRLNGFKEKFKTAAPKRLDTLGAYIVEHCLEYLIRQNPPRLVLIDDTSNERLDLNELFERGMEKNAKHTMFRVGPAEFKVLHVKLYSSHTKEHSLYYCANNRAVKIERLIGKVPDLAKRLVDANGQEFQYAAYLDGSALDETVNQERTDFSMCSEEAHIFESGVSWSQIRDGVMEQIKTYLTPFTKPVKEKKSQRLDRFVATKGPMYRPILKYVEKDIALFDPDIDDAELDLKLYKALHDLQISLRSEGRELMEANESTVEEFAAYSARFSTYFTTVSDVSQSDLARYVFDRKLVLQFFEKLLGIQSEGKYALEKQVHQLIFPMGETSDQIFFENHNLWILDERLVYHKYLASDKQLRKTAPLKNESQKEVDLIVFDKACAFTNSSDGPFQAITIIEFKRPMRAGYGSDDNPFEQVLDYIDEIRAGQARTVDERAIPVADGVHFYCYVVADMTPTLEQQARKANLEKTPDGQGFYGYNRPYKAYIEFLSYSKLLVDAKQRNQVFFEKLGLPSIMKPQVVDPDKPLPWTVTSGDLFG